MTKKYVTIAFAAELANQQKEQVFNLLLGSRLVAGGYILATPNPDLGDDLWLAKREELWPEDIRTSTFLFRGQIKSAQTYQIQSASSPSEHYSPADTTKPNNLGKCEPVGKPLHCKFHITTKKAEKQSELPWFKKSPGYFFFLGISDCLFLGLGEGEIIRLGEEDWLRLDQARVISPPEFAPCGETGIQNPKYRTEQRGFHFGCLACAWIEKLRANTLKGSFAAFDKGNFEVLVHYHRDDSGTYFKYSLMNEERANNITRYFGSFAGLDDAYRDRSNSA